MATIDLLNSLASHPYAIFDNALPTPDATAMEAEILSLPNDLFVPAKMGATTVWENNVFRGDRICWLTPQFCTEHRLTSTIVNLKMLMKMCGNYRRALHMPNCLTDFSEGENRGYVKHMDCSSTTGLHRQLTCILYLNRSPVGGELRLHLDCGETEIFDIEPLFNRLVVFRSDIVPHEVRPSVGRRIAITLWASGTTPLPPDITIIGEPTFLIPESAYHLQHILSSTPSHMDNLSRIFVSIACYRDSEIVPTLLDLYSKAADPTRIDTTILLQLDDSDEHINNDLSIAMKQLSCYSINLLRVPAATATGVLPARARIQQCYSGQHYFLQIDCHIRFRRGFDAYLISTLESLGDKAVLSTYPHAYTLINGQAVIPDDIRPTVIIPSHFDADGVLRQKAKLLAASTASPLPNYLWAAGFSFSRGSVVADCPYEGLEYVFFGEEFSMALRLYAAGYTVYAPSETVVYHLWTRSHRPSAPALTPHQMSIKQASITALLSLPQRLNHDIVSRFEACVGIDIKRKTVIKENKYSDLYANDMDRIFGEDNCGATDSETVKLAALTIAMQRINNKNTISA